MLADVLEKNKIKTLNRKFSIWEELYILIAGVIFATPGYFCPTELLPINEFKKYLESITSDQIDSLTINLKQEINDKQNEIHQLYINKTDDINKIDFQTKKLIEQCEQLELKRKDLIEQIDDYSKLEDHARHVNSNYHQVHHLNQFINGIKHLIDLQNQIHGKYKKNIFEKKPNFLFSECRQLCRKGSLNQAKILSESIENLIHNEYLFPNNNDKFSQQHYPLYETFQRSVRQLHSDICQTHHILWNDGIDRINKNQFKIHFNYLDQLFQCKFYEDKGEKLLIEKNIQTFAIYCLERFIQILIEKKMKLIIDKETTMIVIRLEDNKEIKGNNIEQFHEILNYLKQFFDVLNKHLLSRMMNIQTSNEK